MNASTLSFARTFQIWSYNVSHGELLLRSPKAPALPTRIDILFKDVRVLELRCIIEHITIEEADSDAVKNHLTNPAAIMESNHKVFIVKSSQWVGCVICGAMFWHEDNGEYGEPSALLGGKFRPKD